MSENCSHNIIDDIDRLVYDAYKEKAKVSLLIDHNGWERDAGIVTGITETERGTEVSLDNGNRRYYLHEIIAVNGSFRLGATC